MISVDVIEVHSDERSSVYKSTCILSLSTVSSRFIRRQELMLANEIFLFEDRCCSPRDEVLNSGFIFFSLYNVCSKNS